MYFSNDKVVPMKTAGFFFSDVMRFTTFGIGVVADISENKTSAHKNMYDYTSVRLSEKILIWFKGVSRAISVRL